MKYGTIFAKDRGHFARIISCLRFRWNLVNIGQDMVNTNSVAGILLVFLRNFFFSMQINSTVKQEKYNNFRSNCEISFFKINK